ncbi:MAG: hypothetical protein LUG18_04625 [Candidatus Azobacteroides sp.]|nr:hypothetical protein [Candidatus Azobacteroides sp.]
MRTCINLTFAVDISIISTTTPILTTILAAFFLKGLFNKKIERLLLGTVGILLLMTSNTQGVAFSFGKYNNGEIYYMPFLKLLIAFI